MKTNIKFHKSFTLAIATLGILNSCAEFENREMFVDKPQSIIDQETRDSYEVLKKYIDYSTQPNFKLGAEINIADIQNNTLLYRLLNTHFNEYSITLGALNHNTNVLTDGTINTEAIDNALSKNDTTPRFIHAGHLVWHENQQDGYLNKLIANVILPGISGIDNVVDFEKDAVGTSYPTNVNNATAKVALDPIATGNSGKVLHILKNPSTVFPQFKITLPAGRKLAYYKNVTIDFKGDGCCGFYGSGMRMAITENYGNPNLTGYGSPQSFGIPINAWGRGMMILPIANLNLTPAQKELNTFVLTIGSQTGAPDYMIDNIKMNWEIPGQTIVKTPEEKKEIITNEMDKWLKSIGETGKNRINSWSVVYQPMDNNNPSLLRGNPSGAALPANTFYWQDFLGKDYAAIAINKIKQYSNQSDKIYITETNLDEYPDKIDGLKDFIAYTEQKGAKVDGIATEFALSFDSDKSKVENALSKLASTGKLIKISALDIGIGVNITSATPSFYVQQAEMYKWFVKVYNSNIPANQRGGITFRSPVDQLTSSTWRPNEPIGIFTNRNGYQRKPAYIGVIEAFQNK
ncbi:endo-1,4-beta-xylanase [Sphingobacterium bovistauri]|uniref:Endo-1,4-beta-xylanase n=1 Tax=Sphingobacterium bovistauri TaxID=2781959 RepID=A0ABS7Z379_9SPHI|nr:endo-1,4-beta-xylanase [Sphingobacterium bovistauri]MCA5004618.1 endo-1,4-beta-xylanase [Sphingobacterium bovistauri]